MKYLEFRLGHHNRGSVVEVTLSGSAANVFLVDSSNLSSYKRGRRYSYYGGHTKRSPVRLTVPHAGTWYLIVDTGGYPGRVSASARVLPGALPPIRAGAPDLADVMSHLAPQDERDVLREYDVFISHATEDKATLVRPLAHALVERDVLVWYDEFELKVGDSLRRKIDTGLARSRFGLVVLSKPFFEKGWPQYELDGVVALATSDRQTILPLWHEISKDEVLQHSPSLADRVALVTANYSVEEIADELARVIHGVREQAA